MRGRILLISFLLLVVLAVGVMMSLQIFRVQEVLVEGCQQRDPVVVANMAAIDFDESIFKVNFSEIRESINESPYFEVLDIGYVLPNKIRIRVHERVERAVVQMGSESIVIDEKGYIVEIRQFLGDVRVPVVSGLYVKEYELGKQIVSDMPLQLDTMHIILQALLDEECIHLISEINVSESSNLWMMTSDGFMVELGNFEKMNDKIKWLKASLPVLVSEGKQAGIINISTGEAAFYRPYEGQPSQDYLPDEGTEGGQGDEPGGDPQQGEQDPDDPDDPGEEGGEPDGSEPTSPPAGDPLAP